MLGTGTGGSEDGSGWLFPRRMDTGFFVMEGTRGSNGVVGGKEVD